MKPERFTYRLLAAAACAVLPLLSGCFPLIAYDTLSPKFTGRVIDRQGRPIADLPVTFYRYDRERHGITDAAGKFTISGTRHWFYFFALFPGPLPPSPSSIYGAHLYLDHDCHLSVFSPYGSNYELLDLEFFRSPLHSWNRPNALWRQSSEESDKDQTYLDALPETLFDESDFMLFAQEWRSQPSKAFDEYNQDKLTFLISDKICHKFSSMELAKKNWHGTILIPFGGDLLLELSLDEWGDFFTWE